MTENPKNVVLGVTGSIAAYKAAELVRLIKAYGAEVSVVMTASATRFVGELTFRSLSGNPVGIEMFERTNEWRPAHIALSDRADVLLIAPCTANVIAKLAHGLADDLLACTALATTAPIVVAPAMNEKMWDSAATQENIRLLRSRNVHIVDVATGDLACGWRGRGRMADLNDIMSVLAQALDECDS